MIFLQSKNSLWGHMRLWPASEFSGALWRRGGKGKESLQLRRWNLNICIEKSMRNADWQR